MGQRRKSMKKVIIAVGLPLVVLAIFAAAVTNIVLHSDPHMVDVWPRKGSYYTPCPGTISVPDSDRILVAVNVAECGQTVRFEIDGRVVEGKVTAILDHEPFSTVQIQGDFIPQATDLYVR